MADRDFDLICKKCNTYIEGYEHCPDCGAPCIIDIIVDYPKGEIVAPRHYVHIKKCPRGCFAVPAGECEDCGNKLVYRKSSRENKLGCGTTIIAFLGFGAVIYFIYTVIASFIYFINYYK